MLGDGDSLEFPGLTSVRRLWVHRRASQLKLVSDTNHATATNPLRVSKPAGWAMDWAPSRERFPQRPTKTNRRAEWRTECQDCGETLDAWHALYHYSGMGPLCEDCIEQDPELEGLKWEPRGDFW